MNIVALCLHCPDMRDFHSYLRDAPFLNSPRSNAVFIPLGRAQGHHSVDSLNAEMTGGLKAKAGVGQYAATKHALKAFADSPRRGERVRGPGESASILVRLRVPCKHGCIRQRRRPTCQRGSSSRRKCRLSVCPYRVCRQARR